MIRRFTLAGILLLLWGVISATSFGQQVTPKQPGWRATVECDSLVVYFQMSPGSKVLRYLKKGEVVIVGMEFISGSGTWSSVTEPGKRMRLGYVQSECLEREQPEALMRWEAQVPPPSIARSNPEPTQQRTDVTAERRPTREEIEREVDQALTTRLNALLPASEPGQAELRQSFGFDDQASFLFVPGFSAPFGFFHGSAFPHFIPRVQTPFIPHVRTPFVPPVHTPFMTSVQIRSGRFSRGR